MNDVKEKCTAMLLYSGGLDSILSYEVLRRAGVGVVPVKFHSIFCPEAKEESYLSEDELVTDDVSAAMVELVKDPEHGLGKNVNPCMDCKQMMYRRAWELAGKHDGNFIATGEVVGQRPMSQRRDAFNAMEGRAGVEGMVVRPLCAKKLPPTIPEKRGWIDREKLLGLSGRNRKPQMRLAADWGIEDYPSPAGGCRLTDPNYAERVRNLMELEMFTTRNARLLRNGRLFPLDNAFAVVGRDHEDNLSILEDVSEDALMLELENHPGPLAALVGHRTGENVKRVKELVIRYSRFKDLSPEAVVAVNLNAMRERWVRRGAIEEV